jgi:hypothetical protein
MEPKIHHGILRRATLLAVFCTVSDAGGSDAGRVHVRRYESMNNNFASGGCFRKIWESMMYLTAPDVVVVCLVR